MRPLYIFDLDGTLALIEHRRHFVENGNKQWTEFFKACVDDKPNEPVIATASALMHSGADVWVWSGRSDEVRDQTITWLKKFVFQGFFEFRMRAAGDHRPDVTLKRLWLESMAPENRARLVASFDDRSSVVRMWRDAGVACFQVAPGDF